MTVGIKDAHLLRPLPTPTSLPPYHLDLADILPPDEIKAIIDSGRLVHVLVEPGNSE